MKLLKLTALPLFAGLLILSSCEPDAELKKTTDFQKDNIPMTGAKVVPASNSTALGRLDVFYSKTNNVLKYTYSWSGLSGNPTGIGLFGLAPTGYAVPPTTPIQSISLSGATTTGTRSGSVIVDGVVIKEQDVLNGLYYLQIRTAAHPNGELRAQIAFQ